MPNRFFKNLSRKNIPILGGVFLCIALLFTSCENFLQGSQVHQELEKQIAYANSKQINVTISCPPEMGTVYPYNTYAARLGFDFELQFKPNTNDYVIKDPSTIFEAVKYSDQTISMSDYVQFTAIPQTQEDERDGLYRVKAQVVKESTDILIRPKCVMIPAITGIQTNMSNGILSPGNPVTVLFSMPVNSDTINYTNISIKANGRNISEYFENPELYENKLTIRAKGQELKDYIENTLFQKTIEVTFSFSESITATAEEITLNLKQNEYSTFKLIYNSILEDNAPDCNAFFVTRVPVTLESASLLSVNNYFSTTCTTNDEKLKNRTKGTIYLYGIYNDPESGIRVIKVKSVKTKDIRDKNIYKITRDYEYYPSYEDSKFLIKDDGNVSFCLEHELCDGDGTYELEVIVEDGCGNQAKQLFTVFVENELYGETRISNEVSVYEMDVNEYNEKIKKFRIITGAPWDPAGMYDNENFEVYGPGLISYSFDNCDIVCKYFVNGEEKEAVCNKSTDHINFELKDVDSIEGLLITVITTNDIGNQLIEKLIIPGKPFITGKDPVGSEGNYDFHFSNATTGEPWGSLFKLSDGKLTDVSRRWTCLSGETYYFSCGSRLYGPLSDPFTTESEPCELKTIEINDVSIQKSLSNSNAYDVNVSVQTSEWDKYDSIYLVNPYDNDESKKYYFDKSSNSCSFTTTYNFFYRSLTVRLFGIKNNQIIESHYTISNFSRAEQDEIGKLPPYVEYYYQTHNMLFIIKDNESGMASATVEFCNKPDDTNFNPIIFDEDDLNSDDEFYVTVPIWKIGEAGGIIITATDKKGNTMPGEYFYPDLNCYGGIFYAYIKSVNVGTWITGQYQDKYEDHWYAGVSAWENIPERRNLDMEMWDSNDKCFKDCGGNVFYASMGNEQELDFGKRNTGFYRILARDGFFIPYYFYIGDYSGDWDFLVSNAENNRSVLISSDAPVYVCTFATSIPYDECVNYDANFWEDYKRIVDEQLIDFSFSDHGFKSYQIDLDKIPKNYSFVVVAHYGDGKKMKSPVYYKDW